MTTAQDTLGRLWGRPVALANVDILSLALLHGPELSVVLRAVGGWYEVNFWSG